MVVDPCASSVGTCVIVPTAPYFCDLVDLASLLVMGTYMGRKAGLG